MSMYDKTIIGTDQPANLNLRVRTRRRLRLQIMVIAGLAFGVTLLGPIAYDLVD